MQVEMQTPTAPRSPGMPRNRTDDRQGKRKGDGYSER
ncbi:hypothetical protein CGRA01v4_11431 [Colletotrichum graminicola]|nr:hypothetical protein CGRA01v4_11431 [Colletotrichum graminicola]